VGAHLEMCLLVWSSGVSSEDLAAYL
jgi:hypothetical protein